MYTELNKIEIVTFADDIKVVGLNLQNSGLPISFDSLGKMWDNYTDECRKKTRNMKQPAVEYAICLNKVPDYIVGSEVIEIENDDDDLCSHTIPAGRFIKVSFNAESFPDLVDVKIEQKQKEVKKWAKSNKVKINNVFNMEVYPQDKVKSEYPEMYLLYPVEE